MPLNGLAGLGHRCPRWLRRFHADTSGATAIEFAFVIGPFLMLLFGITAISLFYYTETVLEQSLISAVRQVRTGQSARELPANSPSANCASRSATIRVA